MLRPFAVISLCFSVIIKKNIFIVNLYGTFIVNHLSQYRNALSPFTHDFRIMNSIYFEINPINLNY